MKTPCLAETKTYGNIWTRQLILAKDEIKEGHKHEFDHLHFLSAGSVQISVYELEDRSELIFRKIYTAPSWIKVPKEHFHDIVGVAKQSLGYCIQAMKDNDGEVMVSDYAKDSDWMAEVEAFEKANGLKDEVSIKG